MKQVCLLCERTSPDNNLYCQETYCPAEMSPNILGYGEWLGDIEIIKPVIVLRSATLYEARHQQKPVLLKVAHPGADHKEKLKREAEFLRDVQLKKRQNKFLPVLLPPYANTTLDLDAHGKTTLGGHLLYFYLCEPFDGEPLRDILIKRPQLWLNHVGWLAINLASAIAFLHNQGMVHYGLSPECILVRFDKSKLGVPRILLFDLGIASPAESLSAVWYAAFVPPAYTAPELVGVHPGRYDYAVDVYGLGLILHEMLSGEPAHVFELRSEPEVYRAVQRNQRTEIRRDDANREMIQVVERATNWQASRRYADATLLAKDLIMHFGDVPARKKGSWLNLNRLWVGIGMLLVVTFLVALLVTLPMIL